MLKEISFDNGHSYMNATEAIDKLNEMCEEYEIPFPKQWQIIAEMMDDETREAVHAELAPCTELEFLARYLQLATDDLILSI